MEREEAINIVQGARQYLTCGNPIWNVKKIDEAMSMAIEALSEPSGDLISRAKAKEALYEIVAESTPHLLLSKDPNNGKIYATDVLRAIDHLPSETSQNLTEPNNTYEVDLISRADAIRWVKTECNPYGKPTLDYDSGNKVIEHLKKMPSALPSAEPKTGKWVLDPDGIDWNIPAWRCSECGFVATYIGVGGNPMHWAGSKFCANCGARMGADMRGEGE